MTKIKCSLIHSLEIKHESVLRNQGRFFINNKRSDDMETQNGKIEDKELKAMIDKLNNTKAEDIKLTEHEHILLFNYLKELELYRKLHPKL